MGECGSDESCGEEVPCQLVIVSGYTPPALVRAPEGHDEAAHDILPQQRPRHTLSLQFTGDLAPVGRMHVLGRAAATMEQVTLQHSVLVKPRSPGGNCQPAYSGEVAADSETKPTTYPDFIPATIPIVPLR